MKDNNLLQPHRKISFVVYYPYQWFIYKNIYNKLPKDLCEVIVDLSVHPQLQDFELRENIVSLLTKESVTFRILEEIDTLNVSYFKDFFKDVEVIVSCWESGCVSSQYTAHIKKVATTYGLAKELTMIRPSRSIYDVILAYGQKDQNYFSLLTKSIAIGNPRLDNFYNKNVDSSIQEKILAFFKNQTKKIVLYVPTHGDLSSVHKMYDVLKGLSETYNIIFKPHYYTLREDKEVIDKYKKVASFFVIDDSWDTVEVMNISDIIISDNSSAIFDAMQVDKQIIVCDFWDTNFLDLIHKNLRITKRGLVPALTYSGSLEQEVKDKNLVATIKKPNELVSLLENIDDIDKNYKETRRKIVHDNFSFLDGKASERARDIITHVYKTPRNHVYGILHHAYLAYNNRAYRGILNFNTTERVVLGVGNLIVWVFCEPGSEEHEVASSIYSSCNEKSVKLVCVSGVSRDIQSNLESKVSDNVIFFESHHDGIVFLTSTLKKNDSVLFLKTNSLVQHVETALNLKFSSNRNIIFFAENIIFDPNEKVSQLFYILKKEILGISDFSETTLLPITYEQIHSLEKSGAIISADLFFENEFPKEEYISFEKVLVFLIDLNLLTFSNFMIMPDFLKNQAKISSKITFNKLIERSLFLTLLGIDNSKWPDKKLMKYFIRTLSGDLGYFLILQLLLLKIARAKKHIYFSKIYFILKNLEKLIKKSSS